MKWQTINWCKNGCGGEGTHGMVLALGAKQDEAEGIKRISPRNMMRFEDLVCSTMKVEGDVGGMWEKVCDGGPRRWWNDDPTRIAETKAVAGNGMPKPNGAVSDSESACILGRQYVPPGTDKYFYCHKKITYVFHRAKSI